MMNPVGVYLRDISQMREGEGERGKEKDNISKKVLD
jgi:hypothetical protein